MAAYKNLGDELECPICKDHFKVPKVMGTCLHVACFECLEQLVAARGTDFFPCPVCREKCKVPMQGVAALKDDFRFRAIVEKYQNLGKDKDVIHCSACPNPASHFCKDCENIHLCKACSGKHSRNPLTNAHELVGICSQHGKSLTMYCRECGQAICSVCLIAHHTGSSQEHDVSPHQEVADEEIAVVVDALERLEAFQGQKENALSNIARIRDSVVATIDSDLSLLGKQSESAIDKSIKTRAELNAQSCSIQEQIDALIKKKEAVDDAVVETDKKISSDRQQSKRYSDYLNKNRDACLEIFNSALKQGVAETDDIKDIVNQGREETSSKRVLDDQTVLSLLKVKEELIQALTTAGQIDRVAPFVGAAGR